MKMLIKRRKTKAVKIGTVTVGNNFPVSIQSMTNTDTRDIKKTVAQIHRLEKAGCELIRVAVPDEKSALNLAAIKKNINIPLIADIHFNHELALMAIEQGADKIRINPGNIGSKQKIIKIINKAKEYKIPIRIGVNSGSLEKHMLAKYGKVSAEALFESAWHHIKFFEEEGFFDLVVSIKSSDILESIEAYRLLSKKCKYPLHLGITEAGTETRGTIKSAIGISNLLLNGIGDTLRISLTANPIKEIFVAKEILKSLHLRDEGLTIISCPTCGRCEVDLIPIAEKVEKELKNVKKTLKIAIMGCVVNGPGEAKEADIGVACGKKAGIMFKKGKQIKKISEKNIVDTLMSEIKKM